MEEESDNKKSNESPKLSQNRETFEEFLWDIPFARTFYTFFIREGKAVKSGWVAVLIMVGIGVFVTYSCTKDHYKESISEIKNEDGVTISNLRGQLSDSKADARSTIQDLTTKLEASDSKLAFFEANPEKLQQIYNNIFANTATNWTQINALYQQLTNSAEGEFTERSKIGCFLNQIELTNVDISAGAIVPYTFSILNRTNSISIQAICESKKTDTLNPSVEFMSDIDATNFLFNGWTKEPETKQFKSHFHISYAGNIEYDSIFAPSQILLSPQFKENIFHACIIIHSDNSEPKEYALAFVITNQ